MAVLILKLSYCIKERRREEAGERSKKREKEGQRSVDPKRWAERHTERENEITSNMI